MTNDGRRPGLIHRIHATNTPRKGKDQTPIEIIEFVRFSRNQTFVHFLHKLFNSFLSKKTKADIKLQLM